MKNKNGTYDKILDCARKLIVEGGYNGFSYADIAKVVGIRQASIHHHFPSKVDLVRILVSEYRKEAAEGLSKLSSTGSNPFDQLRFYAGYWETCIANSTTAICVCALLASELPILPQEVALEVRAHFHAMSAWLESVLERGARANQFQLKGTSKAEAEAFLATIHGAMLSARAYGDSGIFGIIMTPLLERFVPTSKEKSSSGAH